MNLRNPFSFPMSVTVAVIAVYLAVFIPLLIVHETVPSAPSNPTMYRGLNLTEAWLDLDELSNGYHPFNSKRNDAVRNWLLLRIEEILGTNGVPFSLGLSSDKTDTQNASLAVTIFDDLESNYTTSTLGPFQKAGRHLGVSAYFEGSNIIVYIRGTEDEEGDWWKHEVAAQGKKVPGKGGVLVNAHFDSVSTGYGATDDGMGVITVLQLIRYFTVKGNTPKKGVVALLNNGEEDGLYGAKAFISHPIASFVQTFLNLEGAGAGGRATLFRSTDTEVTQAYGKAKHPFGTVISSDAFALGFIRSETDYVVFKAEGFRGLDLAFWEPRARYHTDQDDAKHASKESLWHMLSASVETMRYLTSDTKTSYEGTGSTSVYFDLFGQLLAVLKLRTLFALSLTLLIAGPLILIALTVILVKKDKFYFFSGSVRPQGHEHESEESIHLKGWSGFTRFPIACIVSSALTIGAALLLRKINPVIIHSSAYSVWAMSLSIFFSSFWFIMAGYNAMSPSALHRGYSLFHMHNVGWLFLVVATVGQDRYRLSSGYLFVFYYAAVFLATFVTLCELFALPGKRAYAKDCCEENHTRDNLQELPGNNARNNAVDEQDSGTDEGAEDPATEITPLITGIPKRLQHGTGGGAALLKRGYNQTQLRQLINATDGAQDDHANQDSLIYPGEQKWSASLPTWTWLLQFLLIAPFMLILLGQVGLLLVTATAQTGTDGSPLLLPYLIIAIFTILILIPIGPFMHRISAHLPIFLFLVFGGTLVYNLIVFPFSANNRYKAYFQQTVDLDTGLNTVTIAGIEEYVRDIISNVPSAAGQTINCIENPAIRAGLSYCSYKGIAPQVVKNVKNGVPPEKGYKEWLDFNVTRVTGLNKANFVISGQESKACIIRFSEPFSRFHVRGAAKDGKWSEVPETGSDQIKLWHRDWNREWAVDVEWPVGNNMKEGDEGRSGRVVCLWSDHNLPETIPALEELQRFSPPWTSIVKLMDGLVEGSKSFNI